ncbi:MAG TPA: SpoIID/LytB domain-containing protein [Gaiellaceae bacterium]|nr:SpoIID/LytB domain-containing protein [Gaiellaceae bacterium]
MRRLLVIAVLACALAGVAGAQAAPVFVLTGKGWGHGIGLSQYGAQGFAQHGWTYDEILARYYQGTALVDGQANDQVRVLIASGRATLAVGSAAAFELAGAPIPAGTYTVRPHAGLVEVTGNGVSKLVASPATLEPGTASLELGGTAYRGDLAVASSPAGTSLAALNVLGREAYIRGVVPREMPAGWLPEALKAQAVAARTYSLAVGGHCAWEAAAPGSFLAAVATPLLAEPVFCADTRDQVYGGKSAETTATNEAVFATAGEALRYGGGPATTYFFSTSGGRTAAKSDEWGDPSVPYLVSVADPYDTLSPHHAWGPEDAETDCPGTSPDCVFGASAIRAKLGLTQSPVDLAVTARNSSGRVATLEARTAGTTTKLAGTAARTKLGLRSTWFFVGVLSLERSATTVTYGSSVTLSGIARRGGTAGWDAAYLQRRPAGETSWIPVGAELPNGTWTRAPTPKRTTDYRVVSGNATGAASQVSVRTRVVLHAPTAPYTKLTGFVRPARKGVVVTLERRRADGTWAVRAQTATSATGGFSFRISAAGTYRARADAGAGLEPGSDTVAVPSR